MLVVSLQLLKKVVLLKSVLAKYIMEIAIFGLVYRFFGSNIVYS